MRQTIQCFVLGTLLAATGTFVGCGNSTSPNSKMEPSGRMTGNMSGTAMNTDKMNTDKMAMEGDGLMSKMDGDKMDSKMDSKMERP